MSPGTGRLEEWKDIAAYLGRSVKTVQRWHKDLGLPVRRESLGGRVRVFAYAPELDEWMARHRVLTRAEEGVQATPAAGSPRRRIPYLIAAVLMPLLALLLWRGVGVRSRTAVVETPVTSGRLLWRATAEGKSFASAPLPSTFGMAELSADDRTLYCAAHLKSELRIVDTESLAVRTVMLPEPIKAMKMAPDGETLFAATAAGDLLLLEPGTLQIKRRVAVGGPVNDIAVTPDSDTLFLAMMHRGVKKYVVSVDEVKQFTANTCPYFLALSLPADQLAVSYQCGGPLGREGHDSVEIFNAKTGKSLQVFTGPPLVGGGLEFTPTGERLWVDAWDACFSATYDRIGCPDKPTFLYQVFQLTPPRLLKSLVIPQYHGNRPLFLNDRAVLVRAKLMAVFDPVRFTMRERIDDQLPGSGVGAAVLSRDRSRLFALYGDRGNHRLWRVDIEPAQCAQPEVGIVHFLPFDGAPGDFIENAYVASRSGLLFAPGLIGQALHLDSGRDVGFHSPSDIQFPAETSTLAFFVKPAKPVANVPLFEKPLIRGEAGWSLSFDEQSHPVLELAPSSGPRHEFTAGVPLADNVWTHLAFVRDGDTFSAYVNGQPAGSLTMAGIDVKTWARPTAIGRSEVHPGRFEGLLDEFAMWARAFSPGEVKGLYERRLAAPCRP